MNNSGQRDMTVSFYMHQCPRIDCAPEPTTTTSTSPPTTSPSSLPPGKNPGYQPINHPQVHNFFEFSFSLISVVLYDTSYQYEATGRDFLPSIIDRYFFQRLLLV